MIYFFRISAVVFLSFLLIVSPVFSEDTPVAEEDAVAVCGAVISKSINKEATAGIFANAMNRSGSLRKESAVVIDSLLDALSSGKAKSCESPCVNDGSAKIILYTVPKLVKREYSEKEYCARLLSKTTQEPLRYYERSYESREQLQEWVSDFSQGKGKDGEDLYRRCDKSCSPRYQYVITQPKPGYFSISAEVVCGHARDKSDDMYTIKGSLIQSCGASE
jgi:hypothetical protein